MLEPVKNVQFLPNMNSAIDAFKIVWDDCAPDDITDKYSIIYHILIYNNTGDGNSDNDCYINTRVLSTDILPSDEFKEVTFDLTGLRYGFKMTIDGKTELIEKPAEFSIDNISRIEIVVDNCIVAGDNNVSIDTVGIRAIQLKEKGANDYSIPVAHDTDENLPVNPYADVFTVSDMIARLSDYQTHPGVFEPESAFYVIKDTSMTYKIMLHKIDVGIGELEHNPYDYSDYYVDYNPYDIARHRRNVYEELDQKYLDIVTPIMNNLLLTD